MRNCMIELAEYYYYYSIGESHSLRGHLSLPLSLSPSLKTPIPETSPSKPLKNSSLPSYSAPATPP